MSRHVSRRDMLNLLGASGVIAGLGVSRAARADDPVAAPRTATGKVVSSSMHSPASVVDGKVVQPQRTLRVAAETDVLVVGGGPAGVAAALAARRTGAKVLLVERYGHFGGLWTGGLVLIVIGMHAKGPDGKLIQVTRGIGEEMMQRLGKVHRGIVNHRLGASPTVDAEALKYVMVEMVAEAGVDVLLHSWCVDAIVDGKTAKGAIFESKSGRQAILAKVVIDASGDGDIYAAAGAEFEHHRFRTGLVHRIGNLDKVDAAKAKGAKPPRGLGGLTPIQGVNWVNMQGPEADGLEVRDLTRLEMNHRRAIWRSVERVRQSPGYERAYLLETAPQLGVRITRLLTGVSRLTYKDSQAGTKFPDAIGVGGPWGRDKVGAWQIPYGCLVPRSVDGVLAAGRCISGELRMADLLRIIPPCFVTGHAAGVAAAVSAKDGCPPRAVEVPKVQRILKEQGAYLA